MKDTPAPRRRRVIAPAKLVKSAYLESENDVDRFLEALRAELSEALANNERIEIR